MGGIDLEVIHKILGQRWSCTACRFPNGNICASSVYVGGRLSLYPHRPKMFCKLLSTPEPRVLVLENNNTN